jgi:hypothetical protein
MVTMLHSVHTGGEGEEGNMHQQQRLMRLQTSSRGRSCWSPPFQVLVSSRERWLVDSGASCHMTGARELFDTLTETGSDLCVELGTRAKHSVRGSNTISFRLESGEILRVSNVLWVPELRRSVLSVSEIERKGYHVLFRYGQVLLVPRRN